MSDRVRVLSNHLYFKNCDLHYICSSLGIKEESELTTDELNALSKILTRCPIYGYWKPMLYRKKWSLSQMRRSR